MPRSAAEDSGNEKLPNLLTGKIKVPTNVGWRASTPANVHDITEEGSDMTRDIFFAILKDTQDGRARPKSLPDQSDILHEDIGTSVCIGSHLFLLYRMLLVLMNRCCSGKASDIAQPGGFRRDHVISNLGGNSPHVPVCVQDSFLESIQPTPGFLQSAYGDFIVASLDLAARWARRTCSRSCS